MQTLLLKIVFCLKKSVFRKTPGPVPDKNVPRRKKSGTGQPEPELFPASAAVSNKSMNHAFQFSFAVQREVQQAANAMNRS